MRAFRLTSLVASRSRNDLHLPPSSSANSCAIISAMDIDGFLSFTGARGLSLPGAFGMNGSSSYVFGFRTRCFCGFAAFMAFTRLRRFASFASWLSRRRNRMMEEINFRTSSRPSWLTLDVGIMEGNRCQFSTSRRSSSAWFSSTEGIPGSVSYTHLRAHET